MSSGWSGRWWSKRINATTAIASERPGVCPASYSTRQKDPALKPDRDHECVQGAEEGDGVGIAGYEDIGTELGGGEG
jgi:hypothetical protein